jgi:hypothetical protein
LQSDPLAHVTLTIDGVYKGFGVGFQQIALGEFDHIGHPLG